MMFVNPSATEIMVAHKKMGKKRTLRSIASNMSTPSREKIDPTNPIVPVCVCVCVWERERERERERHFG